MKFGVREICDVVFKANQSGYLGSMQVRKDNQFFILIVQKLLLLKVQLLLYMQLVVRVTQDLLLGKAKKL